MWRLGARERPSGAPSRVVVSEKTFGLEIQWGRRRVLMGTLPMAEPPKSELESTMAELAFPLFNLVILGSFLGWGVVEYVRSDMHRAE